MIVVNDDSPSWLRELNRFLPLKNLLFIHGNILDLVSFPVRRNQADKIFWIEDELTNFFHRYLVGVGYRMVGFIDPVDGLTFKNKKMGLVYDRLEKGREVPAESQGRASGDEASQDEAAGDPGTDGRRISGRGGPGNVPPEDLSRILTGVRTVIRNTKVPCAFIFNLASRLVTSPDHVTRDERGLLTRILKISLEGSDVLGGQGLHYKNIMILICDKLNDLPPFLFVNNPRSRSIYISKPDSKERSRFFRRLHPAFHGAEPGGPTSALTARFSTLTEGLTNYELMSLVHLSRQEKIEIKDVENLCHRYKYGVKESEWDKLDRGRLAGAEEHIRSRVKGQDEAISRVLDIIKRARVGLAAGSPQMVSRPRGVLFFAGPTGVGKTEMAKSLAELLFGQEDRCIRFDMSEYSSQNSDEKLLGAPPGYIGYEEGGQLTNAIKTRPFSVLLFDEIEKAHGRIFDKFLQILDDGRLTDGKGETVYFSESIIIFTSNLGTVSKDKGGGQARMLVDPSMPFPKMREMILEAIRDHFNLVLGRPEILNRFGDNFVVFDFIKPPVDELIVDLLLSRLKQAAADKWKIELKVEPKVRGLLVELARQRLHHGGRGIRNVVDSALVNPLTRFLFDHGDQDRPGLGLMDSARIRIDNLLDHGPDQPYRFEVEAEIL